MPRLHKTPSRIAATIALTAALAIASVPASACGGGFLFALMFKAFPETRTLFNAELSARKSGVINPPVWPGADVVQLHTWRRDLLAKTLERVNRRLDHADPALNQTAFILLIHEYQWLELTHEGDHLVMRTSVSPTGKNTTRIFTTRAILDALLDRNITFEEAAAGALIVANETGLGHSRPVLDALGTIFDMDQAANWAVPDHAVMR